MAAERKDLTMSHAGSSSNTTVPQSLLQQANVDSILQAADELALENPDVGRICMCKFILLPCVNLK